MVKDGALTGTGTLENAACMFLKNQLLGLMAR